VLAKLRVTRHVQLPPSSGLVAGDLIRTLEKEREAAKPRLQRGAVSISDA
jgi:hypothetical protein